MTRIATLVCLATLALASPLTAAQSYPSQLVRLIVPYAAGGPADLLAREIAKALSDTLGQQVIVEPKPGGGAIIGADFVAKARPDGYNILVSTAATHIVSPAMMAKPPYDGIRDFTPVCMFATVPNIITVYPGLPIRNVKELIAYARSRPGKLTYGSAGNGSAPHLAGELFNSMAGVELVHVPYKGAAPAVIDMVSGQVDLGFVNISAVLQHIKAGKLRAVAIATKKRSGAMPELPSVDESGLPGYDSGSWYGLSAPPGLPRPIVNMLHQAMVKAMSSTVLKDRLLQTQGAEVTLLGPDEFTAFMRDEQVRLVKLVKAAGLKMD